MQTHYTRFGRRYRIPSTVEILDELRSDFIPGYTRKSWAQFGFVTRAPAVEAADSLSRRQACHGEASL
jgi:hypothetical protein